MDSLIMPMRKVNAAYEPLVLELARQEKLVDGILAGQELIDRRDTDISALDWAAHVMEERTDESRPTENRQGEQSD